MIRLWPLARREYLERVRSKAFVIATVLGPVLLAALMILPGLLMARETGRPLKLAILDGTGLLEERLRASLESFETGGRKRFVVGSAQQESSRAGLRDAVVAGSLDGYLYIPPDALERSVAEYHGKNVSNVVDIRTLDRILEQALIGVRFTREGLDPARLQAITRGLELKTIRVSETGEREDRGGGFLFSIVLLMMLYATVLMWGQALMTGVIEEKNNRVVEVMVSSVSSTQLLAGKLIGVGGAGLTQFLVWTGALAAIGLYAGGGVAATSGPGLPEITPLVLGGFVTFFLLGYFLYACLYAAIGAAVNTVQEAQSLVFPVIVPLIVSMMLLPLVMRSPDGGLAVGLSLFPLFTPLLMFLRITVLPPPAWQIGLSVVLTLLAIAGTLWVAARIYRVGILMYGKRPTFPEIVRWVRHH